VPMVVRAIYGRVDEITVPYGVAWVKQDVRNYALSGESRNESDYEG
jgi:hypothetical protein